MPRRRQHWKTDWFFGAMFCSVFLLLALTVGRSVIERLELSTYDFAMRMSDATPNSDIVVVAIDDASIGNIGRWPWSRDILGQTIEHLSAGGARVIGSTVLMSEPQLDPGLDVVRDLSHFYTESQLSSTVTETMNQEDTLDAETDTTVARNLAELQRRLEAAIRTLDYDQRFASSVGSAGNVVVPMIFHLGQPLGRPDQALPPFVARHAVPMKTNADADPMAIPSRAILPPTATIGRQALALGHLNVDLDIDGKQRREALLVQYYDRLFPSMALAITARSLNLSHQDIEIEPESAIRLGGLEIATTPQFRMFNFFYPRRDGIVPFDVDSFYDVFTEMIPADKYRNKIVLIGATAAGIGDNFATPIEPAMPPVIILAHTISSLLQEHFITRPSWAVQVEYALLVLLVLYVMFLLPRMTSGLAAGMSLLLVLGLLVTEVGVLLARAQWVQLMLPVTLLVFGHLIMTVKRSRVVERLKHSWETESVESNKMLGLAFQGQGQLDMAFEKFRKCPTDDSMMDLLYNLGLDYERKRQFNKAGTVYRHMASYDAEFRDLRQRLKRSDHVSETMVLGRSSGNIRPALLLGDGSIENPMLGRYEIEKELGKGAMGVVYQGRDPKINRVVAVKVIPLSEEFEEEDLEEVKGRFFREAETAGRLNHPNIVTIFDAGEEHDLAYIAMELLHGDHLNRHTKPDDLLPLATVIDVVVRAAEALHYAHERNVIHRDIKPANIMYEATTGSVKVTDFGIARITDSSKTKTGIILGTPSYMSPEQLAGEKLDGRSDLFSLGVALFQLSTGELPFQADSMSALMYKIANDIPNAPREFRPDLPDCLCSIIEHALQKDVDERYQSGEEMAAQLRRCGESLVS